MRTCKPVIPVLVAFLLPTCQRQEAVPEVQEVPEAPALVRHTLYASTPGDEDPATRTVLDEENDREILWSPGESVSVLSGGGNYSFQGDNGSPSASASFTGLGPVDLGSYIALYPYQASALVSEGYVSTTLPVNQTGKAGSFADGYLITADDAEGDNVSFNHVCSGLRFQVSSSTISAVSIRGNNGEKIAGNFRFRFASEDTPVAQDASEEVVTLTAPGGYFELGKYYYIVILPTVFSGGFTLMADNGSQLGELRFNSKVIFSRGTFKNITGNLNERMSWNAPKAQVYYGSQNTYILSPGERLVLDVQPRKIYGDWQRSGLPATSADTPASSAVLWGGACISYTSVADGRLTVSTTDTPGRALVAVNKDESTLWSFLVWVKEGITETTLPNGKRLLPPLGDDCYFQWGRKDPLLSSASRLGNEYHGLAGATTHPTAFIKGVTSAYDWFCEGSVDDQDATLWGGTGGPKTVWDPCPQGYRVPSEADYTHDAITVDYIDTQANGFLELGFLNRNEFYGSARTYWTRSVNQSNSTALDNGATQLGDPVFYGFSRDYAIPIRCVKE